jgi:hypothetical protein
MIPLKHKPLLIIGFVLVLIGFLLPALMTLRVIESTFFLNFFSYAASISGLMLGIIGAAIYTRINRK